METILDDLVSTKKFMLGWNHHFGQHGIRFNLNSIEKNAITFFRRRSEGRRKKACGKIQSKKWSTSPSETVLWYTYLAQSVYLYIFSYFIEYLFVNAWDKRTFRISHQTRIRNTCTHSFVITTYSSNSTHLHTTNYIVDCILHNLPHTHTITFTYHTHDHSHFTSLHSTHKYLLLFIY